MNDHLFSSFTQHDASLTPREVIHPPERIEREEERERGDSDDVEDHPTDHIPFPPHDKHQRLQPIDSGDHDKRKLGNDLVFPCYKVHQVHELKRSK